MDVAYVYLYQAICDINIKIQVSKRYPQFYFSTTVSFDVDEVNTPPRRTIDPRSYPCMYLLEALRVKITHLIMFNVNLNVELFSYHLSSNQILKFKYI